MVLLALCPRVGLGLTSSSGPLLVTTVTHLLSVAAAFSCSETVVPASLSAPAPGRDPGTKGTSSALDPLASTVTLLGVSTCSFHYLPLAHYLPLSHRFWAFFFLSLLPLTSSFASCFCTPSDRSFHLFISYLLLLSLLPPRFHSLLLPVSHLAQEPMTQNVAPWYFIYAYAEFWNTNALLHTAPQLPL